MGEIILRNVLAAAALLAFGAHGGALQIHYRTAGEDVYRVGNQPSTQITYSGTQVLAVQREDGGLSFTARARCDRIDPSGTTTEQARFVQAMLPDGSFEDRVDDDPDFLTILNQPFAIRLDPTTIHDLAELHAPVPFSAASPVGTGSLTGALRPGTPGIIDGHRVVGVEFRANGSVNGPLPGHAATIQGRIRLDGTAYYDVGEQFLLALDARLTIDGLLSGGHLAAVPVRIIYDRTIKID